MSDITRLSDEKLAAVNGGAGKGNDPKGKLMNVDYQIIDPKNPTAGLRASYSSMEEALENLDKFPGCIIREVRV
ncbi:MAG: hypothetical protein K5847_01800 [Lachnospiraceae bacterium]|nr:hypothetical protein [Lachnospiraceae bacterium]